MTTTPPDPSTEEPSATEDLDAALDAALRRHPRLKSLFAEPKPASGPKPSASDDEPEGPRRRSRSGDPMETLVRSLTSSLVEAARGEPVSKGPAPAQPTPAPKSRRERFWGA